MVKSAKNEALGSQQPMISMFFSQKSSPTKDQKQRKRSGSPVDLTFDDSDDDAPPRKRTRTNGLPQFIMDSHPELPEAGPSGRPHVGQAEQWRFVPSSPEEPWSEMKIRSVADEEARKKNHELFKKKLLEENSMFIRKKSSREGSEAVIDVDSEYHQEHKASVDTDGFGNDSDPTFTALHDQFSNKSKDRGKGKALKKKVEDVGPSGQTWTPLEKQVRRWSCLLFLLSSNAMPTIKVLKLKKDNPGVLLMVEVGYKLKFFDEDAKVDTLG